MPVGLLTLQYYAPDYELDVRPSNMDNANSQEYLQKIKIQVIENLKRTTFNPSVQMTDVPRDPEGLNDEADAELDDLDEDENPDTRYTKRRWDKYVEKDGELSESEDEEENEANGVRKQPGSKRRKNIMDYQNPMAADTDEKDAVLASGAISARSGRSPNGVNGSRRSSAASEGDGSEREHEASSGSPNHDEEDVEMADDPGPSHSADGAQEATPPESPPDTGDPAAPAHAANNANDVMDEGDTLDDPELAKEEGQDEREQEDVTAEKTTGAVKKAED